MKNLPVTGCSILLLLFVGVGFVSSDPGTRAVEAGPGLSYVPGDVQDAHLGYYEEHLARLAAQGLNCR